MYGRDHMYVYMYADEMENLVNRIHWIIWYYMVYFVIDIVDTEFLVIFLEKY